MGRCVVCQAPKSTALCTGCGDNEQFLCPKHAMPCIECDYPGPYCPNCDCTKCKFPSAGLWSCEACDAPFSRLTWRAKCVDCDEFDYCKDCVRECQCGQGPQPHYLCQCVPENHTCQRCYDTEGTTPACQKYGQLELAYGSVALCQEHRVAAKKRRKELADME